MGAKSNMNKNLAKKTQTAQSSLHPEIRLYLARERPFFGLGPASLLRLIQETQSVRHACEKMKMSYSKGWKIINRAEKELGYELLERRHGGKSGGKCTVTEKGKSLMKRYRQMEKETRDCLQKSFEKYFPEYQRIR